MSTLPPPPKVALYKRWWFWFLVVVAILIACAVGLQVVSSSFQPSTTNDEQTVTATVRTLNKAISTTGKLVPEQTESLIFLTSGKVTKVNVGVGDLIDKDQILVQVGSSSIKAPFDGRVLALHTFVDDTAVAGTIAIEVGYRNNVVEFVATESEIFDLAKDQATELTVPSYENGSTTYHGTVSFVDTKKNTAAASLGQGSSNDSGYLIRITPNDLPEAVSNVIDLTVEIKVVINHIENALSIERGAVQYDDNDSAFVYIPSEIEGESAKKQTIETGFEGDDYIEIKSGLKDGDVVALDIPAVTSSIF